TDGTQCVSCLGIFRRRCLWWLVGKKLLVLAIASVVAVVLLEIAAAQLYRNFKGRQFARSEIVARLYRASAEQPEVPTAQAANDPRVADQAVMIHPYFGYV